MNLQSFIATISFLFSAVMMTAQTEEWELFQSEEGLFQVEMPALPIIEKQQLHSSNGELLMHLYIHQGKESDNNLIYMINYVDYPEELNSSTMTPEAIKDYFRNSVDGAVANVQGKLLSEKVVNLAGYPGRAVKVDFQNGLAIITMFTFLVENRMYAIQTIALTESDNNIDQQRFFESFELLSE